MSITAHSSQSHSQSVPTLAHQLFHGTTWHSRLLPSVHKFAYSYRYWGVNISALAAGQALPEVDAVMLGKGQHSFGLPLFSAQHKALQQFCADDYLIGLNDGDNKSAAADINNIDINPEQALEQRLHYAFITHTGSAPTGDMIGMVVCQNVGIYFSPVNFYLGFDDEQTPSHLLAEVSNTPWNKRHYYGFLLTGENTKFCHDKNFHVSPFNPIDQQYHWQVSVKSQSQSNAKSIESIEPNNLDVRIAINISDARGEVLRTGIKMIGETMTAASIQRSLKQNPLMNISSLTRIYYHAFKLYAIKKVPYINYDEKLVDSEQQDSEQQQAHISTIQKDTSIMPVRPTDRTPTSALGKITARLSQAVNDSAVLQPVNNSVNYLSRKAIFQALQHIQFGSLTLIEDFDEQAPKTRVFGKDIDSEFSRQLSSSAAQQLDGIH